MRSLIGLAIHTGLLLGLLSAAANPTHAEAQQGAKIVGRVTDALTGAPIWQVQVFLMHSGFGTLTKQDGSFVIDDVPPGPYVVRTERVGLAPVSHPVTVVAGKETKVAFELTTEVIKVDGIVIKGRPGG